MTGATKTPWRGRANAAAEILEKCIAVGGTVSGEHGIGTEKQNYMSLLYTQDDLDAMWDVKCSFDPQGRLNPGKIFPRSYQLGAPVLAPSAGAKTNGPNGHRPRQDVRQPFNEDTLAAALEHIVGRAALSVGRGAGYVAGYVACSQAPCLFVRPGSVAEVAEVLHFACSQRLSVTPIGGGTKRHLGGLLSRCDIVLSLERLNAIVEHYPSDLTLSVQAGATLAAVNDLLASAGQMLPLDAALPQHSTVGGIVAAGAPASGLRRLAYGTARDMLIGVQVARADGRIYRRGGMVVKNVAGYDLTRLQYGAFGALGVITVLNFKLQPRPETSAAALGVFATPAAADLVAQRLRASRLQPAAVLLFDAGSPQEFVREGVSAADSGKGWRLLVRFDGRQSAVLRQVSELAAWMRAAGGDSVTTLDAQAVNQLWPALVDFSQMAEIGDDEVLLRANVRSSDATTSLSAFEASCAAMGLTAAVLTDLACGVMWLRIHTVAERLNERLPDLVQQWRAGQAQVIVAAVAPVLKARLDLWGSPPPALRVMQQLKQRFDPHAVLNMGRDLVSASLATGCVRSDGQGDTVETEAFDANQNACASQCAGF